MIPLDLAQQIQNRLTVVISHIEARQAAPAITAIHEIEWLIARNAEPLEAYRERQERNRL